MPNKIKRIDDLYFGVCVWDFNHDELTQHNLFQSLRVKRSVARYIEMLHNDEYVEDPLSFCFGDTRGRVQYELDVTYPISHDRSYRVSTYELYVLPNRDYLMSLVNSVTLAAAKKWLKDNK